MARLRVRDGDAEALRPLLGVARGGLQDQGLVSREDLEGLGDVARAAGHFHRTDLVDVYTFAAAL